MIYCLFLKLPLVTSRNFNMSSYIFISTKVAWRLDRKALPHIPEEMCIRDRGSSYYDYSVSVNRSFLKEKRLTVSAFVGNFFKKYMKNKNTLTGDDFWQESTSRYSRQRFGVSVSYRIGELKASVKKAARSIENDDVKGGEGGGGQGGSN